MNVEIESLLLPVHRRFNPRDGIEKYAKVEVLKNSDGIPLRNVSSQEERG